MSCCDVLSFLVRFLWTSERERERDGQICMIKIYDFTRTGVGKESLIGFLKSLT